MTVPRIVVGGAAALARLGADRVIAAAARAIAARGHFSLVLSGGSTPKALYQLLGDEPNCVDWSRVSLYFGDERHVAPEHADSNFKMANDSLISRVNIPAGNVHRIKGEADAAQAASEYHALLQEKKIASGESFDLVLLGMGADGHTASLFPETTALDEKEALVTSTWVEKLKTHRITLTPKALLAARAVVFLIGGADKVDTLREVLEGEFKPRTYPSQLIFRGEGAVELYGDRAATAKLA
jgi:6-phosphogluconolactonase